MTLYSVLGPQREDREFIDYFIANAYPVYDWFLVEANNRKDAAWAAFRRAKENKDLWYTDLYDEHPLKGVKIELFPDPSMFGDTIWDEDLREFISFDPKDFENPKLIAGKKYYINALQEQPTGLML